MHARASLALVLVAGGAFAACGGSPDAPGFTTDAGTDAPGVGNASGNGPGDDPGGFGSVDGGNGNGNGNGNGTCGATTLQAQKAQVDIIFFVDTSGSMSEEIAQIKTNINSFAQKIGTSGLDYQVIMIAARGTGQFQICVPAPLGGASCGDNAPKFRHVNQTISSTNGLARILSTYDTWKSFLRMSAYKAFVAITDDNSSLAYTSFDTQLLATQPAGMFGTAAQRRYIMNSICGWKEGTAVLSSETCDTAENPGLNFQNLSKLTNGIVESVCKTNYDTVFDNIAKGLVTRLGCELAMPKAEAGVIDPTKVVVQYTPGSGQPQALTQVTDASKCAQFPDGWHYDNNASPTKIVLCASKCTAVGADLGGKLEVLVGCAGEGPR